MSVISALPTPTGVSRPLLPWPRKTRRVQHALPQDRCPTGAPGPGMVARDALRSSPGDEVGRHTPMSGRYPHTHSGKASPRPAQRYCYFVPAGLGFGTSYPRALHVVARPQILLDASPPSPAGGRCNPARADICTAESLIRHLLWWIRSLLGISPSRYIHSAAVFGRVFRRVHNPIAYLLFNPSGARASADASIFRNPSLRL
ncbi:hypothetical protein VUR80DRAFT_764 [Thermomyces stellatus]